jgi:DNA repair photolyase
VKRDYNIIKEPDAHAVLPTKKELHGWYPGRRECTAERMLINPYNGCGVGCFYCYARALPGYFGIFHHEGTIFISKDFDKTIAGQLDSLNVASCGYLSPVTDPFQKLNGIYRLSEKIVKVFVERNIPIEFITKSKIPDEVIELMKGRKHCFGQVSILTVEEPLRKIFSPSGATTDEVFADLSRLAGNGIHAVCRIDPVFPYITDKKDKLKDLVDRAVSSGASHIIASVLDLPVKISEYIFRNIKSHFGTGTYNDYKTLYTEKIGYLNARIDYRKKVFDYIRNLCDKKGVTFALCMEYEIEDNSSPAGLNRIFMSSTNCEGIDIPIYIRKEDKFYPAADCSGNCLNCTAAKCGISDLAMGISENSKKNWKLKDYKRWSGL